MPKKKTCMAIRNKPFFLFSVGQGISNIGDTFQLVAVTAQLFNITGSGLSTGFGILFAPIPAIILSLFAGSLGDRHNSKHMLVLIDLLRAFTAILFVFSKHSKSIYILMLILYSLNALYGPPSRKLMTLLLSKSEMVSGNSIISGVSGIAYIIGPLIAGVMVDKWGYSIAFAVNSISFIISAVVICFIRLKTGTNGIESNSYTQFGFFKGMGTVFKYVSSMKPVKEVVVIGVVVAFGTASVNVAFYPYAFDFLKVTNKCWGLLLTVLYGTNLLGMFITIRLKKQIEKNFTTFIYFPLVAISVVWFCYGITLNLGLVLILQFVEGILTAVYAIVLSARLQLITKKSFMARVTGVNDILSNFSKLSAIVSTYVTLIKFLPQIVFKTNAIVLLIFCVCSLVCVGLDKRHQTYV